MSKILKLTNKSEWSKLFKKLPKNQQDIYYNPEYYALYQQNGDGEANCFVFEKNEDIVLYPFLKNSINKLDYKLDGEYFDIQGVYGYNGIITSSEDETLLNEFHSCFDNFCVENNIIAEFTRFHPLLNNHIYASNSMQLINSRKTIFLDLSLSIDEIWTKQFNSNNRNVIRKAEKEGVNIVESDDYASFYELYNRTMINVHADDYYFFSINYFKTFRDIFKRNSALYLAMYNDRIIAGSMFMFSELYGHYHLSARDMNYSKLAANSLLLKHGILKAKERGCKYFHLGGGTTENNDDSLLLYKKKFSKQSSDFYIGKRIHNQIIYNQLMDQWKSSFPENYEKNKVKLLGYREI